VIGVYEAEGAGGLITQNMREMGGAPKVVFGNAMSISYSDRYDSIFVMANEENGTGAYTYGSYYRNGHSRAIFDVFRSGERSVAYALKDGDTLKDENGEALPVDTRGDYRLMTLSKEDRTYSDGKGYTSVERVSYVCAVGSTEFASNQILKSNAYGNTDLLLETLRTVGKEMEPIGIEFKPLYRSEMTEKSTETGELYYTKNGLIAWTVVLMVLPAVGFASAGVILLVKRRTRT
jgi:hypothetical protein